MAWPQPRRQRDDASDKQTPEQTGHYPARQHPSDSFHSDGLARTGQASNEPQCRQGAVRANRATRAKSGVNNRSGASPQFRHTSAHHGVPGCLSRRAPPGEGWFVSSRAIVITQLSSKLPVVWPKCSKGGDRVEVHGPSRQLSLHTISIWARCRLHRSEFGSRHRPPLETDVTAYRADDEPSALATMPRAIPIPRRRWTRVDAVLAELVRLIMDPEWTPSTAATQLKARTEREQRVLVRVRARVRRNTDTAPGPIAQRALQTLDAAIDPVG